ncbi:MAG: thioredoxin-dependent thiol peroxidase [Opitutales bacterium]
MSKPTPLEAGKKAPVFSFVEYGKELRSDEIDSPCLLYFYPKDDTPGCTKQACGLRDRWSKFKSANLRVIGVSKDDEASHKKFREKFALPFPLIADTSLELANAYGVYGEKNFMGRTYEGIHRMSFLIGIDGIILKTYPKVVPGEHADTVLHDLAQLTR